MNPFGCFVNLPYLDAYVSSYLKCMNKLGLKGNACNSLNVAKFIDVLEPIFIQLSYENPLIFKVFWILISNKKNYSI